MTLNRVIKPNISKTSKNRYRVRLSLNGTKYEGYFPSLTKAIKWRNSTKLKYSK